MSLVVLAVSEWPLTGQSLGELARQEEARRKTVTEPSKVITNKDLSATPPSPAVPPAAQDAKVAAPPSDADKEKGEKDADKDGDKAKKPKGEPVKDRAYWSGRLKALQAQLDRDETYSQALQSQINALTADFVNRDDPAQRAIISRDRQKAVAELDRLKEAIQNDKKALAELDEEARRAAVPPGWLR
jgi:hypothetical protein